LKISLSIISFFVFCIFNVYNAGSQDIESRLDTSNNKIEQFNKPRFYATLGIGSLIYGSGTYGLVKYWYSDYGFSNFHFFDDKREWLYMDKIGHIYTAYNQSSVMFDGARWTGMKKNSSLWFGVTMGMVLQSTIEVLDGFSPKWGFSIADMSANIGGASLFYAQQEFWGEQRIVMKVSSGVRNYSNNTILSTDGLATTSLNIRADELFGKSFPERYLKDYNAQAYWLSFNLSSLSGNESIPKWLNLSVGYSGQDMFGGFTNQWADSAGNIFNIENNTSRYGQFYLTPDIDFRRIPVKSQFLKALFKAMNLVKFPMPGIEVNTKGSIKLHYLIR
jgi:hypothetical protein